MHCVFWRTEEHSPWRTEVAVAKLYSKEVEHSEENMEFLEEDFQFEDIFAPEQMIRQLFFAS